MALSNLSDIDEQFHQRPDALRAFRDLVTRRTGRTWSQRDLEAIGSEARWAFFPTERRGCS
jgi:hypothetical protein